MKTLDSICVYAAGSSCYMWLSVSSQSNTGAAWSNFKVAFFWKVALLVPNAWSIARNFVFQKALSSVQCQPYVLLPCVSLFKLKIFYFLLFLLFELCWVLCNCKKQLSDCQGEVFLRLLSLEWLHIGCLVFLINSFDLCVTGFQGGSVRFSWHTRRYWITYKSQWLAVPATEGRWQSWADSSSSKDAAGLPSTIFWCRGWRVCGDWCCKPSGRRQENNAEKTK